MGDLINACLLEVGDVVRFPGHPDDLPPVKIVEVYFDVLAEGFLLFQGDTIYPQTGENDPTEVTMEVYAERQIDRLTDDEVATLQQAHSARLIQESAMNQAQQGLPG